MDARIFVTGASGLIGRSLVAQIERAVGIQCTALSRSHGEAKRCLRWLRGDLLEPAAWSTELRGFDAVVHLAALTGRARAAEFERTIVGGTQAMLEASRAAGVRRFVHVSTIAATFPEKRAYPYAAAKERSEELVRASGLDWTIVRPSIVLGPGSPIAKSLAALARLPVTPIFGDGKVRIQPVHADDVAAALWDWQGDPATIGQVIEIGGPEVLSFEELFRRLRLAVGKQRGPLVHLPLATTLWTLAQMEKLLPPVLPVTAGQLYSFRYDSTASPSSFTQARHATMCDVEHMLADAARETA